MDRKALQSKALEAIFAEVVQVGLPTMYMIKVSQGLVALLDPKSPEGPSTQERGAWVLSEVCIVQVLGNHMIIRYVALRGRYGEHSCLGLRLMV